MIQVRIGLSLAAILALCAASCMSQRRGEPVAAAFDAHTEAERVGGEVFMRHCHQCHPGGMRGLGPAINDKPLPAWLIKFQVRNGLGAMPAFDEQRISDPELDALAAYVLALRDRKPRRDAQNVEMASRE
ncbi:MAG TPA: cytochrome c [Phycisphaerales bacterium]|nr:cytochrome c [Phycisphaerales bacterium]